MIFWMEERTSERKWRLFAVACCRRVWPHIPDARSRQAVESAEQFADGLIEERDLQQTYPDALAAFEEICRSRTGEKDLFHPMWRAQFAFRRSAPAVVRWACLAAWTTAAEAVKAAKTAESVANSKDLAAQCELLRELIGNPFRPVSLDPAWQTAAVFALAQAAYDNRILPAGTLEPLRLAILADALEEAGCTEQAILDHLRGSGPHVRGCWALDAVLGKN
jgi:hypothetical protein